MVQTTQENEQHSIQKLTDEEANVSSLEKEESKIARDSMGISSKSFVATKTKLVSADSFDKYD